MVLLSGIGFENAAAQAVQNSHSTAMIQRVNWLANNDQTSLFIEASNLSGSAGQLVAPSISSFEKGSHIKLTFDQVALTQPIAKISARGLVKAAFVTKSFSAAGTSNNYRSQRVNLDIFLHQPGQVIVENVAGGAVVHIVKATQGQMAAPRMMPKHNPSAATAQTQSQAQTQPAKTSQPDKKMQVAAQSSFFGSAPNSNGLPGFASLEPQLLNDGSGAVDVIFNGPVPDLKHFQMSDPPRIIIDIEGTTNRSGQTSFVIGKGLFTTAQSVTSADRLRLIINLKQSARFEAEAIAAGYRLTAFSAPAIENTRLKTYTNVQPPISRQANSAAPKLFNGKAATIAGVDFRRTAKGQGRVIVNLNDSSVIVNFKQRANELIASFVNATVSAEDEKRLDVVDFATPVETVDLIRKGANVELVVTPRGQFKHNITQTETQYIIDVSPLSQLELLALEESETGYKGETLSLNFQSIPVRAALQVIADFTGLNIITSDSVTGDLSLRLNDVPWDQALDLILQTKSLSMRQTGNVIRVAPAAELAAQEKREFESKKEVANLEPLTSELIRVNYAKAEDIGALLKSVKAVDSGIKQSAFGSVSIAELKTDENSLLSARGSVTVDARTNTLLIQDTPSRIRELRKLISKLDIPVKQIQIETRIVEATDDFSRSLGARLGFLRVTDGAQLPGTTDGNSVGTIFGSGNIENNSSVRTENTILYPDDLSVNLPADPLNGNSPSSYAYQIVKIGAGYLNLLDLEISALQAEGKGKIIANPKITTTDKHEARIEQGQERFFGSSSLFSEGGTVSKKAVLSLSVLPQVTPDNEIILDVKITNDSFAAADTLNTKRIETQTLLRNGETVVIGGIYQQAQADSITKTPILGDIPVLGNLFKKRTKRDNRTELLIFLTPRIINADFK